MGSPRNTEKKFWSHVDMSNAYGCWPWQRYRTNFGYGKFMVNGKTRSAARLAKLDWNDLDNPLFVLHRCDNPACCRPSHLFLGTPRDNMTDRDRKGRQVRGERAASAKLTSEQVVAIRIAKSRGERTDELARQYGIHRRSIWSIVRGRVWKHLKGYSDA